MIKITPELAEICGIHAGDGYLRNKDHKWEWDISGNIEEKDYYDKHMIPLFNKTFNLNIKGKFFPSRNTYGFVIRNKKVIKFAHEILGFPYGNKTLKIKVPKFIFKDKFLIRSFLRGYFDTDGCISFDKKIRNTDPFKKNKHYYPRITIKTVSNKLGIGVKRLLEKEDFSPSIYAYQPKKKTEKLKYTLQINGKDTLLD